MRGCLFTILLGAIVAGFLVVVVLPAAAAGILTTGLAAAGLHADDTTVTVSSDPPTDLLGLRADHVRVRATNATFRGIRMARLELSLGDVRLADRTAGTVDGQLTDVSVANPAGGTAHLGSITLAGRGDAIAATTVIPAAEAEALIADAVQARTGVRATSVVLAAPDRVTVTAVVTVSGRLAVNANHDLVIKVDTGLATGTEVVLIKAGDLPIELRSVSVTRSGDVRLSGILSIPILG
jgi:hypothetical protein